MERENHTAVITSVAQQFAVRADILHAQVLQESNGDTFAFRYEKAYFERYIRNRPNVAGARYGPLAACSYGLLQIMLETALEHGFSEEPERLFIPTIGLTWGVRYFRRLLDKYSGDYEGALIAYNGGPGVVKRGRPYATQAYADAVLARV